MDLTCWALRINFKSRGIFGLYFSSVVEVFTIDYTNKRNIEATLLEKTKAEYAVHICNLCTQEAEAGRSRSPARRLVGWLSS